MAPYSFKSRKNDGQLMVVLCALASSSENLRKAAPLDTRCEPNSRCESVVLALAHVVVVLSSSHVRKNASTSGLACSILL